jgi:hypothetical protein
MQPVAAVVQHEESEQSLLERARQSVSQAGWTIGECASVWTQRYARGRTDADFAALIGSTQQRVNEARRVHELYGHVYRSTGKLSFTHYCSVLGVDCADDALEWAEDNGATVAEMKAWLRMQNGEDLTVAATEPVEGERVTDDSPSTSAIAPADHDPSESIQRGDTSAPVIGIPADQLDRDRTKEARERATGDRVKALREARAMFRAASRLCAMGLDAGCIAIANECRIEARQGEVEVPDDRTLAALLQLGERK